MFRKYLSASMFATAICTAGFTAYAGQSTSGNTNPHMPHFVAHHGFMQHGLPMDARPKLGAAAAVIPQADLEMMSIEYGVRIMDILTGSLAEEIGLKDGDIITDVDGRPAYSPRRLQYLIAEASGASTITLIRSGESQQLQVEYAMPEAADTGDKAALGIRIQALTEDLKEIFGVDGNQGVLVSQVIIGAAASEAGLKAGDVIVGIADQSITSVSDVHDALGNYKPGETLDLSVLRNRQEKSIQVVLGTASGSRFAAPYGTKNDSYHNQNFHGPQG